MKSVLHCIIVAFTVMNLASCDSDNSSQEPVSPFNGKTVTIAAIGGISAPITGETPVTVITENEQYRGTVTWSPAISVTFAAQIIYTATITLTAKDDYTLQGIAEEFFTVAGAETVRNDADSGVITVVFPKTTGTADDPAVIDIAAIQGLIAPITGEIPVMAITENEQYSGTVTWSPAISATFAAKTAYTATITLTAKDDYTLQGVAEDFFTVEGAETVSNDADSGVITAVFPATKDVGEVVSSVPILSRVAHNRILIHAIITPPATRQSIEYGISASNDADTAVWQKGQIFTGLNAGTVYYIFARAAENANYNAGAASSSLQVTTRVTNVLTVTNTTEWNDALAHIAAFGSGTADTLQTYTITVNGEVAVPTGWNSFGTISNVAVTLNGSDKLYLNSQGNMLRIASNQTLIIDSASLILQGHLSNNTSVVYVNSGGKLELRNGTISGNTSNSSYGGGVYVSSNATFTMNGGTISDNTSTSSYGGGVYVASNATFTMNGGTISDNTSNSNSSSYGGGVYVNSNATFTMNGGTISDNTSNSSNSSSSNSSSYSYGGGVYVNSNATFTMSGEITISDNTSNSSNSSSNSSTSSSYSSYSYSYSYGGGVYASYFTMSGGTISGNTSNSSNSSSSRGDSYGGGVYASYFTMSGGTISGNTSSSRGDSYGGGVYASYFTKSSGGIIYGNDVSSSTDKNTTMRFVDNIATFTNSHAVSLGTNYYRNSTLGINDNLFSSSSLPATSGETFNGWTKR